MDTTRETTKRLLKIGTVIFILLIIVGYAYITTHSLLSGPSINITDINNTPAPQPIKGIIYDSFTTSTVTINGIAQRIQSITLNGSPIQIDEAGNFSQTVTLFHGFNAEVMTGKDAFGNTIKVELDLNRE